MGNIITFQYLCQLVYFQVETKILSNQHSLGLSYAKNNKYSHCCELSLHIFFSNRNTYYGMPYFEGYFLWLLLLLILERTIKAIISKTLSSMKISANKCMNSSKMQIHSKYSLNSQWGNKINSYFHVDWRICEKYWDNGFYIKLYEKGCIGFSFNLEIS